MLTEKGDILSDWSISFSVPRFRNARAREVLHKKMAVEGAILQCCFCLISILGDPGAVSRGRRKGDDIFQELGKEPLGNESQQTISKRLGEGRLLIALEKSFELLCQIGDQQLWSYFRVFLYTATVVSLLFCFGFVCGEGGDEPKKRP